MRCLPAKARGGHRAGLHVHDLLYSRQSFDATGSQPGLGPGQGSGDRRRRGQSAFAPAVSLALDPSRAGGDLTNRRPAQLESLRVRNGNIKLMKPAGNSRYRLILVALFGLAPGPKPVRAYCRCGLMLAVCLPAGGGGLAQSETPDTRFQTQSSVSFRNEVMAVFSKAGCNAGTCHGNKNGKGGFKLSLRGQDPEADYLMLTRDLFSLRVNPLEPEQSLVLLKPTTQVSHQVGLRFG